MEEVRACDFCGGGASGVYEVVPAETGASGEARRMVLCDGCRDTLASVVDPLLAAGTGADGSGDDVDEGREVDRGSEPAGDGQEAAPAADATEAAEAGGRPIRERGPPQGYRKVMRFLENREFPMDRGTAEALAADAYGLSETEVSAVIDHAVTHGRLRDVNGELRR